MVKAWEKGHDLAPAADYAPLARGVGALIIALLAQVQWSALRFAVPEIRHKIFQPRNLVYSGVFSGILLSLQESATKSFTKSGVGTISVSVVYFVTISGI